MLRAILKIRWMPFDARENRGAAGLARRSVVALGHAVDLDSISDTDQLFSMTRPTDACASCGQPVTAGDHDRPVRPHQVRECPICGSDLTRTCERLDGSRVFRCSGGHVLDASALEMF